MKEVSDSHTEVTIEVNKSGAIKSRTFQGGVDFAGGMGGAEGTLAAPVIFVGYGISEPSVGFDELKGMNLKGKTKKGHELVECKTYTIPKTSRNETGYRCLSHKD
jgi:hypothetical protein